MNNPLPQPEPLNDSAAGSATAQDSLGNKFRQFGRMPLTFVRGIAQPGEEAVIELRPWHYYALAFTELAMCLLLSIAAMSVQQKGWSLGSWLVQVVGFALGQASMWTMRMLMHHEVHEWHTPPMSKEENRQHLVWAEILGIVTHTSDAWSYAGKHLGGHHPARKLASEDDPDLQWLVRLGFRPGKQINFYWIRLVTTLVNPWFYMSELLQRTYATFSAPAQHRLWAAGWWVALLSITAATGSWELLARGYLVPLTLQSASALLQTLSEHRWLEEDQAQKTFPRLLPVDLPARATLAQRLLHPVYLAWYLYWRLAVYTTDLSQHQLHHTPEGKGSWAMVAYSPAAQNQRDKAIWGVKNHLTEAFTSLAQAKAWSN